MYFEELIFTSTVGLNQNHICFSKVGQIVSTKVGQIVSTTVKLFHIIELILTIVCKESKMTLLYVVVVGKCRIPSFRCHGDLLRSVEKRYRITITSFVRCDTCHSLYSNLTHASNPASRVKYFLFISIPWSTYSSKYFRTNTHYTFDFQWYMSWTKRTQLTLT